MLNDDYINDLVQKAADFGNGKIHIIVVSRCAVRQAVYTS